MNENALQIYRSYGGDAAVDAFLAGFAPTNPQLAELTVDYIYGRLISSPVLTNRAKAAIILVALGAHGQAPSALQFHKSAFQYQGASPEQANTLESLGSCIATGDAVRPEDVAEVVGMETALLALLAGYATRGKVSAGHLGAIFGALQQHNVAAEKINFTLCLVTGYAGFPAAIAASAALQEWQSQPLVAE